MNAPAPAPSNGLGNGHMLKVTRRQAMIGLIIATLSGFGGLVGVSIDWAIKKDAQLGYSEAQQDSLVTAIKELKGRVRVLEIRAGVKTKKQTAEPPAPRKGLLRRLFSKLF